LTYFGDKSELITDGGNPPVVKVTFNDDSGNTFSSKVNIYRTGSIVIQGSKCTFFEQKYFKVLKKTVENVKNTCNNEDPNVSIQSNEDRNP